MEKGLAAISALLRPYVIRLMSVYHGDFEMLSSFEVRHGWCSGQGVEGTGSGVGRHVDEVRRDSVVLDGVKLRSWVVVNSCLEQWYRMRKVDVRDDRIR